jgi:uncharacterized membrane protein YczE
LKGLIILEGYKALVIRLIYLFSGFFVLGASIVFVLKADLGVDSWNVFHTGLALHLPFTVGQVMQLVGVLLIAASCFFKIKPGLGTVLNMYFIGLFVDFIIKWNIIPPADSLLVSWLYMVFGIGLHGIGAGMYINARLGAGPRDGLMLGLSRITGKSIAFIKTVIELTVLTIGFFLGGKVGIGTLIFALSIGHSVQWGIKHIRVPAFFENVPKKGNSPCS